MGMFDWLKGKKERGDPPPHTPGSMVFANDIVLSMLVGAPGGPADALLARVEAGEINPIILDASLYWAMSAVQPSDEVQTERAARLLRYARILPIDREGSERGHPMASPEEIAHWREVALEGNSVFEVDPARPAVEESAEPALLCSQCYSQCQGRDAHVIPWWNGGEADFFTTYRCGFVLARVAGRDECTYRFT